MRISDGSSDVCSSDLDLGTQWGNLLALLGAGAVSVYVVVGRPARQRLSLTSYAGSVYGVAALALVLGAVVTSTPLVGLPVEAYLLIGARSEARRVGKEWVRTCRSRWSAYP